jgi:hypothetical protein
MQSKENVLKDHQENKHPKSTFEVSIQHLPVSMLVLKYPASQHRPLMPSGLRMLYQGALCTMDSNWVFVDDVMQGVVGMCAACLPRPRRTVLARLTHGQITSMPALCMYRLKPPVWAVDFHQ